MRSRNYVIMQKGINAGAAALVLYAVDCFVGGVDMDDDFEKRLGASWRGMGEWTPPLLSPAARKRLVGLRRNVATPFLSLIWRTASDARDAALEMVELVGAAFAPPAAAPLLRGDAGGTDPRAFECRFGDAVVRLTFEPAEGDEIRLSVCLDGGGKGNFSVELVADDDIIESRPLRQVAALRLKNGGDYQIAILNGGDEFGRIRFQLDKRVGPSAGEASC